MANSIELRRRAEASVQANPPLHPETANADSARLIHELQVHQIELEMQNEELRRSEAALKEQKERYYDFYDFSPSGFVSLDPVGTIIDINLTGSTMLGLPRANLIGTRFVLFFASADLPVFNTVLREAYSTAVRQSCELMIEGRDRPPVFVQIEISLSLRQQECRVVMVDITRRKQAESQLLSSLKEKNALIKETNHRVKNSLQIVIGLLNLQANKNNDPAVQAAIVDANSRIRSMSLLHDTLSKADGLSRIHMPSYVETLCAHLWRAEGVTDGRIELARCIGNVFLDMDQATPCGLIINELVTNSLKHAFPGERSGKIHVELKSLDNHKIMLSVADNGAGLPPNIDPHSTQRLGLQLINMLTKQLKGSLEIFRDNGVRFQVTFNRCGEP